MDKRGEEKDENANPPNSKYSMSTEKKKERVEWSGKRDDEEGGFLWEGGKSCTSWLRGHRAALCGLCVRRSSQVLLYDDRTRAGEVPEVCSDS